MTKELFAWISRAHALLKRRVMLEEIRRIRSIDFDVFWIELKQLRSNYILQYVVSIARINATERMLMELNKYLYTTFPPVTIISKVFHTTPNEEPGSKREFGQQFYEDWATKFIETDNFERTLVQYEMERTEEHATHVLELCKHRIVVIPHELLATTLTNANPFPQSKTDGVANQFRMRS
ncbi:hypothetical protein H0H93_007161 [Arthromyces matolae]|nr:hypothetical protein H0H93_007161 [Arthromyces matolae]